MSSPSVVSMFRARNLVAKAARNSVTSSLTARGVPIRLASTTPPHNPSSTPSGSSPNEPRWTTNSSGSDEPAYNWQNILLLAGLAGIGYFIYDFRKRSKAEREVCILISFLSLIMWSRHPSLLFLLYSTILLLFTPAIVFPCSILLNHLGYESGHGKSRTKTP